MPSCPGGESTSSSPEKVMAEFVQAMARAR
jgi:hypothetical protein